MGAALLHQTRGGLVIRARITRSLREEVRIRDREFILLKNFLPLIITLMLLVRQHAWNYQCLMGPTRGCGSVDQKNISRDGTLLRRIGFHMGLLSSLVLRRHGLKLT